MPRSPGSARHAQHPCGAHRRRNSGQHGIPRFARLPFFVLSVAALVTLCTDPAEGGGPGNWAAGACVVALVRGHSSWLIDCNQLAIAEKKQCGGVVPSHNCGPAGEPQAALVLQPLRGGAPASMPDPWNMRTSGRQHALHHASANIIQPHTKWTLGAERFEQHAGEEAPWSDDWQAAARYPTPYTHSRQSTPWLHELLDAEPGLAQLVGDLATGGRAGGGLLCGPVSEAVSVAVPVAVSVAVCVCGVSVSLSRALSLARSRARSLSLSPSLPLARSASCSRTVSVCVPVSVC